MRVKFRKFYKAGELYSPIDHSKATKSQLGLGGAHNLSIRLVTIGYNLSVNGDGNRQLNSPSYDRVY